MKQSIVVLLIALGVYCYAKDPIRINVINRNNGFLRPPPVTQESLIIPDQWFDQILDHDTPNFPTWKQKYWELKDNYKPGGPVFIFVSGEGPGSPGWMYMGTWLESARKYNAHCFELEHRFYGDSHPTPDLSVENLKLLTSEQAIDDIAHFIKEKKRENNYPEGTKWVAFGGSYAGNLVAWLRLKYPDLVDIAVASSAPVLAKLDYYEYYEVVAESLHVHNSACTAPLKEANEEIDKLLDTQEGIQSLASLFHVCDGENALQITNNKKFFVEAVHGFFADTVQYNDDNGDLNINTLCDIMVNTQLGTPIQRLAALGEFKYGLSQDVCLVVDYQESIDSLKSEKWEDQDFYRQWLFQTCNEFGYYHTSSQKVNKIWGNYLPIEYYVQQCQDIYGPSFDRAFVDGQIAKTNANYKGLDIDMSHIVHIHGSIDPWHALGVINSTIANMPSILIEGASHCADMYNSLSGDSVELQNAKKKVSELIGQWLQE